MRRGIVIFFYGLFVIPIVFAIDVTNEPVLVVASSLNPDLMDTSIAANRTVIDREEIERSGAVALPELLEQRANLLVRSTSATKQDGQISMRGFGDNSHLRVLVLVDGHKINRPDMAGISWQNIPLSSIEKIEVIKGGQNVLYGNHALSGVIKITTRRGEDVGFEYDAQAGSFGYYSGSVNYGCSTGDVEFVGGVQYTQDEGFRDHSSNTSATFNVQSTYYISDTDTLIFHISGGKNGFLFPGPLTYQQMQEDPSKSNNLGDQYTENEEGLSTFLYETDRDWGAARVNMGVNFENRETAFSGIFNQNDLRGFSFTPRIRFGSEDSYCMTGFDFFYDYLHQENYLTADRDIVKSWAKIHRITTAPYFFVQKTVYEKWVFNGGTRVEYAGTENRYIEYVANQLSPFIGPFPNPNYKNPPDVDPDKSYEGFISKWGWAAEASVSYHITKALEMWLGYDRVYRYPTLDETASYQGYPLADPLNKNLDPETGNNFEWGSRFEEGSWFVSLTAFYLMLDNEIGYDETAHLNRNIGATCRRGIESEVRWENDFGGLSTAWTFVDARFANGSNKGNRVPLVPWGYSVSQVWIHPFVSFRLGVSYTFVSEQYQGNDDGNVWRRMDSYGLVGMHTSWEITPKLGCYFSIQNILNETYASSAYSGGFYPGSGRSFQMGIRGSF